MNMVHAKERELRALMIRGLDGDSAAHRALLSALSGHLRAYYRNKLVRAGRGAEEAEDLVQEALMAIHTRRGTYDPAELLTPWVYAIARYKLIDHLRRSRSSQSNVPIEDALDVMAADDQAATESSLDLTKLLTRLPEKNRLAIRYVKIDGLSVVEAAARCGISESAVKINVHRGLKALSAAIAQDKRNEHG
ncbi:sigma-70 family RNA polymerase sigma factor [Roseiarcaceae bacterium H3SJ34-1]|uniref:sigma-70 family RNA polymerase sigma factor n=1 Tax=Terripilifer ovatus TaxID=3032367 RepID=UPI003AB96361|nr:sigma-70 family RNA polymerase sigma factor [Roseiarcaceae bacterium H3SJ34-1]